MGKIWYIHLVYTFLYTFVRIKTVSDAYFVSNKTNVEVDNKIWAFSEEAFDVNSIINAIFYYPEQAIISIGY